MEGTRQLLLGANYVRL